jgi:hypothetical protein
VGGECPELIVDEAHELRARLRDAEKRGLDAQPDHERDQAMDLRARVETELKLTLLDGRIEVLRDRRSSAWPLRVNRVRPVPTGKTGLAGYQKFDFDRPSSGPRSRGQRR